MDDFENGNTVKTTLRIYNSGKNPSVSLQTKIFNVFMNTELIGLYNLSGRTASYLTLIMLI